METSKSKKIGTK